VRIRKEITGLPDAPPDYTMSISIRIPIRRIRVLFWVALLARRLGASSALGVRLLNAGWAHLCWRYRVDGGCWQRRLMPGCFEMKDRRLHHCI